MKLVKMFGLVVVFMFAAVTFARAEELKFAYVDLAKLFDQYDRTKEYDKVLEADNNKFQDERNKKIDQIRELQGKAAMLKDEAKAKNDKDIEKLKNDILEFDRSKRTDLTKARDEKVREILLEIEKTVSEYAKAQDITFVLNDRVLIYGKDTLNITDPILKTLNDSYAKQPKK
ncbi:MAG: OmpH family outer membrane protein [Candidatus Omnitrophica bacterium]|nr:OmpH family outer membrane protein [Candidatus Omnitrophota bacterium]